MEDITQVYASPSLCGAPSSADMQYQSEYTCSGAHLSERRQMPQENRSASMDSDPLPTPIINAQPTCRFICLRDTPTSPLGGLDISGPCVDRERDVGMRRLSLRSVRLARTLHGTPLSDDSCIDSGRCDTRGDVESLPGAYPLSQRAYSPDARSVATTQSRMHHELRVCGSGGMARGACADAEKSLRIMVSAPNCPRTFAVDRPLAQTHEVVNANVRHQLMAAPMSMPASHSYAAGRSISPVPKTFVAQSSSKYTPSADIAEAHCANIPTCIVNVVSEPDDGIRNGFNASSTQSSITSLPTRVLAALRVYCSCAVVRLKFSDAEAERRVQKVMFPLALDGTALVLTLWSVCLLAFLAIASGSGASMGNTGSPHTGTGILITAVLLCAGAAAAVANLRSKLSRCASLALTSVACACSVVTLALVYTSPLDPARPSLSVRPVLSLAALPQILELAPSRGTYFFVSPSLYYCKASRTCDSPSHTPLQCALPQSEGLCV